MNETDNILSIRHLYKSFPVDGREVEVEYHSFELAPDTPVDFDGGVKHSLGLYDNFDSFTVDASNKTIEVSVTAYLPIGLANGYYHMDFKVSAVGSTAFDFATVVDRAATPVASSSAE